jgi:hypothetical protein
MSALTDLYIKKDVLKTLLDTLEKKGDNGISITISISDEPNNYNQNVSSYDWDGIFNGKFLDGQGYYNKTYKTNEK